MAELLVKAVDAVHADAVKDARGSYKRGDVVVVMPDGHTWGREELLAPALGGKFIVVKIAGVDPEAIRDKLQEAEHSDLIFEKRERPGEPLRGVRVGRRTHRLDFTGFSPSTLVSAEATGVLTLTAAAARAHLLHKKSGARVLP